MEDYGYYYLSANASSWDQVPIYNMSNVSFGPATIALINESGLINPSQQALDIMMNSSWPVYVTGPYQIVFHLANPFAGFLGTQVGVNGLIFDTQFVLDHGGFGTPARSTATLIKMTFRAPDHMLSPKLRRIITLNSLKIPITGTLTSPRPPLPYNPSWILGTRRLLS